MSERKASHEPRARDRARAGPFPWTPRAIGGLISASAREFVEDKCTKQAAALSYYTLFALGPLLALAIGVAGLVFGASAARAAIFNEFERVLGPGASQGFAALLTGAGRTRAGVIGTVVGSVLLVLSAGAVFAQLKEALNTVWEVVAKKPEGWKAKIQQAVRKNVLSFAGIMGAGFLLLVSLVISTGLAAFGRMLAARMPGSDIIWNVVNVVVSLAVIALVFAALFKFLPDARVAWRDVVVGGVVTAALFLVGQYGIGFYVARAAFTSAYGAAGALLVVIVWVYYSSLILFFGAELTQVFANRHGAHVRGSRDARDLPSAVEEEQAPPEIEGTRRRKKERGTI